MFWLPVKWVFFIFFNFYYLFILTSSLSADMLQHLHRRTHISGKEFISPLEWNHCEIEWWNFEMLTVFPAAFARRIFFFLPGNSGSDWQAYLPTKLCKRRFPLYQNAPKIWVGGYYKRCVSLSSRRTVIVFGNLPHTPIPKLPVPAVTELGGTPCSSRIRSRCGLWIKSCST